MEPKFQTSFIPKSPMVSSVKQGISSVSTSHSIGTTGLISTVGTLLFIVSLLASGALFGYEHVLNSQLSDLSNTLVLAKSSFDPDTLTQLVNASNQINSGKTLLRNHIAASNIFALFEANLLPKVTLSTFDFSPGSKNTLSVSVSGEAASYGVLAEQANIFSKISYMKDQSFSDLNLSDKGTVLMKFQATVDPTILGYDQVSSGDTSVDTSNSGQNLATSSQTMP